MSAEIAMQKAVRARLIDTAAVTQLVPSANILDRNERPNPDPSIIIGEGISRDEGDSISRSLTRVWLDLHVWKKEPSTAGVKAIAGAIRAAFKTRVAADSGFHVVDCFVETTRFLRDPDGETSHGVVTINAKVQEVS